MNETTKKLTFRNMELHDVKSVYEIECASFATPWTMEAFEREIEENVLATYIVVELEDKAVAYGGLWVIIDEAHITNIAVLPDFRGQNIGEKLVNHMMLAARKKGALKMTLEVRVSNIAAQNLYRKLGFEEKGMRKGYYSDNGEDALIMWVNL
jgi:[ribosomal protein S18]-alanine N-acetyltransferase